MDREELAESERTCTNDQMFPFERKHEWLFSAENWG